jgi:hypothetical protein
MRLHQANPRTIGPRALHAEALNIRSDPIVASFLATMIGAGGGMVLRGDVVQPMGSIR